VSAVYTVTHNLHTRDVVVRIYDLATFEEVSAKVVAASDDTVTITFAFQPPVNAYRVVVFG